MNKVFINNKPLLFTSQDIISQNTIPYQTTGDFHQAIAKLQDNATDMTICHPDIDNVWKKFKKEFKNIYAAGGVVINPDDQILMIYRLKKWDLPKGKMEKGEKKKETALREVEEECGISNLEIIKKLPTTYHMYFLKEWILKITYWYEMKYEGTEELVPQNEEGITKAEWISKSDLKNPLSNTYSNISELLLEYIK